MNQVSHCTNGDATAGEPPCSADVFEGGEPDDAMLARLLKDLADAVVVVDRDGGIVLWNAAAARLLGWTTLEAAGKTFELIVPAPSLARQLSDFERAMATGEVAPLGRIQRGAVVHKDGRMISVAWSVTLLRDPAHRLPHGMALVIRNDAE